MKLKNYLILILTLTIVNFSSFSAEIYEQNSFRIEVFVVTPTICNNNNSGLLNIEIFNGTPPYQAIIFDNINMTTNPVFLNQNPNGTFDLEIFAEGDYDLIVQDSNLDEDIFSFIINSVTLDTNLTVSNNELISNQTNATYQWFNCDTNQNINGANSISFSPNDNSMYAVRIYDLSSDCFINSECAFIDQTTLSTSDILPNDYEKIFLNLVINKEIIIDRDLNINHLKIFDLTGRLFESIENPQNPINLEHLQSGIYLIYLDLGKNVFSKKIVIK